MVACTYNPCRPRQENHHRFEVSLDCKVRPDVRRAKRRQSKLRKTSLWDPTSSLDKGGHGFTAVIGLKGRQRGQGWGVGGQGWSGEAEGGEWGAGAGKYSAESGE